MTYAKKYGNYGIYGDEMLYKWFKDFDKALDYWDNEVACDSVKLVNMRTGEIVKEI